MVRSVAFYKVFLYTSFIFLLWLLSSPLLVAQSQSSLATTSRPNIPSSTSLPTLPEPTAFTECLAQAAPLGVEITITRSGTVYQPGDSIPLLVQVKNNLPRSVNDGVLFARVSRTEGNAKVLVFETVVGDIVALKQGEKKEFPLSFVLPKSDTLIKGDYKAELYLLDTHGRVALSSPPLFDSIANFTFTISGPRYGLYLEPQTVRINGTALNTQNEPLSTGSPITFTHTVINDTNQSRSVTISYGVFYEDDFVTGRALYQKTDSVSISSKEKKGVTHTVPALPAGAYLLKATILENGQGVALANARFTIGGTTPRLRFSGVVSSSSGRNLIACLGTEATTTATIAMSLINEKGTVLFASSTQTAALRLPLSKKHEKQDLTFITLVKSDNGEVTDRWEQVISCQENTGCGAVSTARTVYVVLGLLAIVLLLTALRYYLKRKYV